MTIDFGESMWLTISFAGGCFGFSWLPFFVVLGLYLLITYEEEK